MKKGYRWAAMAVSGAITLALSAAGRAQPVVPVTDVRVVAAKSLPTVKWQRWPVLGWSFAAPEEMPEGGPAQPELALIRLPNGRVQLTLRPNFQGTVFHSGSVNDQLPVRPGGHGGAFDVCRGAGAMIRPLRFDGVQGRADGGLDYVRGFAWFNGHRCTVHSVRRRTARAVPIMDGVFAFLSRCDDCAKDEREELHVIRSSNHEDVRLARKPDDKSPDAFVYRHHSTSIAPGTSGRIEVALKESTPSPFPVHATQAVIEVQRGSTDKEPFILAYKRYLPKQEPSTP